ncbi:leucine-rich repeat-containing protein 47-like [Neodiprion virginianus]|uniref:leucine-rich repeat-containing protein 47-like n=1 Tax=Neodiprion virginianus TaxID=2961670 RepID=UPI001EE71FF1|nr:leucine-rich repeat-containing protein 47-like [Neodiprion virginianus]
MTSGESWSEVSQARKENRHELVLSGASVSHRLEKSGLDKAIFNLHGLNYLNINDTCLDAIPDEIGKLENLTSLVLHSNKIAKLPSAIGKLTKLKVLDVSRNNLDFVPDDLGNLPQLMTLNLGLNALKELPSQAANIKLSILDLSNNEFDTFPDVCYAELVHLAEVRVNGNKIKEIPSTISALQSLKLLDLSDNSIVIVPKELSDCGKLKELNLKGNPLSDKRLYKLVDQCRTKQVLDYVRQHCPKVGDGSGAPGKSKKGKKGRKSSESNDSNINSVEKLTHKLRVLKVMDETPVVQITEHVKTVRPHIVACVVRNLSFTEESFKKFIQLQTKLHEGICEKRNAATIATHDLDLIKPGNLMYTAKPPKEIEIKPLMRQKSYTGAALFQHLQTEADNLRREKKRNVYSGIHRYLYLLEGKALYPCLLDSLNQVISFPPITNSDITKMSPSTKAMFIEVTSASSQQVCRKVADQFLNELVMLGLGCSTETDSSEDYHNLLVEQIKVVDVEGNMKLVYPSRSDLIFENSNITIIRE